MICPKCSHAQPDGLPECGHCGVIFEKYYAAKREAKLRREAEPEGAMVSAFIDAALHVPDDAGRISLFARGAVFILLVTWGLVFLFSPFDTAGDSVLHLVNTPFHEAGHIVFSPFGSLMHSLGGTLGQLLMPLVCSIALVRSGDAFGGSVALWWHAENYIDIAPYVNDARSGTLPLLGGNTGENSPYGFHDWEFILGETNLLQYDHLFAQLSYWFGILVMALAYAWGGYLLLRQYRNASRS